MTTLEKPTAVILCGGFGTRLRSVLPDTPKALAPINGKPFLAYQIEWLRFQGVKKVILAVGYKSSQIREYFGSGERQKVSIEYSEETSPLGTGGAIKNAFEHFGLDEALITNGDSFVDLNLDEFVAAHRAANTALTIACHKVSGSDRYGVVEFSDDGDFQKFTEKKEAFNSAWVNSGIYLVKEALFTKVNKQNRFSFESDILSQLEERECLGFRNESESFIDIGIPDSLAEAQSFFSSWNFSGS